jgi:hypothetical protein
MTRIKDMPHFAMRKTVLKKPEACQAGGGSGSGSVSKSVKRKAVSRKGAKEARKVVE